MSKKEELTGFKKFVSENKSLFFTIPVFVVLLVVVLFVYVFNGDSNNTGDVVVKTPTPVQTVVDSTPVPIQEEVKDETTEVTTLPDSEREKDDETILRNPFALPYKVSGIIYDTKGNSVAIIEAENKSYIVKVGDNAEDFFTVLSIEKNSVVIEAEGKEVTLSLLKD